MRRGAYQQTHLVPHIVVESRTLSGWENLRINRRRMGVYSPTKIVKNNKALAGGYEASAITASAAGTIASAATIAAGSGLIATGTALAATVPVIGWIAGAIAVIAGVLTKVFGKRKQRKAETRAIRKQIEEMTDIAAEIDYNRKLIRNDMMKIQNEMLLLGYTDVIKNNPIPSDTGALGNAKSDLADAKKDFEAYNKVLDAKVKTLESDQKVLQSWYDALTGAKKRDNIILGVGVGGLLLTTVLLLSGKKDKSNG